MLHLVPERKTQREILLHLVGLSSLFFIPWRVFSFEYAPSIWAQVPLRGSGNCEVLRVSTRIDSYVKPNGFRFSDTCVFRSSIINTKDGARAQFIDAWATSPGEPVWYWSSFTEINCVTMESRGAVAWEFRATPFSRDAYVQSRYYSSPGLWAKAYPITWDSWSPIVAMTPVEKWLCQQWRADKPH